MRLPTNLLGPAVPTTTRLYHWVLLCPHRLPQPHCTQIYIPYHFTPEVPPVHHHVVTVSQNPYWAIPLVPSIPASISIELYQWPLTRPRLMPAQIPTLSLLQLWVCSCLQVWVARMDPHLMAPHISLHGKWQQMKLSKLTENKGRQQEKGLQRYRWVCWLLCCTLLLSRPLRQLQRAWGWGTGVP